MASELCELPDGRRVRFSLNQRDGRSAYFVYFRLPDGRRTEASTKEMNRRRAQDAAFAIIRDAYAPSPVPAPTPDTSETPDSTAWDDALKLALRHMRANNLRPTTIQQYELAVKLLRKVFPDSKGPADITPKSAEQFKLARLEDKRKPRTVENDINNLSIVYGHWFRDTLKIIDSNPFADVTALRYDKAPPRYIARGRRASSIQMADRRGDGDCPCSSWRLRPPSAAGSANYRPP